MKLVDKIKVGEEILIVEDCRPDIGDRSATGQVAIFQGQFPAVVTVFFNVGGEHYWIGSVPYEDYISGKEVDEAGVPMKDTLRLVEGEQEDLVDLQLYGKKETSPRLGLPDGSVIWGTDCWWVPVADARSLEEEQAALANYKDQMKAMLEEELGGDER